MKKLIKIAFLGLWLILFYELLTNQAIKSHLMAYCSIHPYASALLLVALQILLASFALPCSPLSVTAGALWSWHLGFIFSLVATLGASIWTFVLGRFVFKNWFLRKQSQLGLNISRLIEKYQWKASMVAHANPLFPGSSLGYAFGASVISFRKFLLGVILGTLPLQLIMITLGNKLKISDIFSMGNIFAIVTCVILLIAYLKLVPKYFSRNEHLS
jgi:uncharacterized membrane protein YdjX (TVP38/TMEM64 family)